MYVKFKRANSICRDGNISNYEIRSLMNSLGYSPSEEDISTVISKVDTNGNKSLIIIQILFYDYFIL